MDLCIVRTTMSNLHQSTPTVIHPGGPQRGARPGVRRRWKRWYLPMQSCIDSASANSRFSVFFGARFWRKWLGNGWKPNPQCSVLEDVTNIYKFTTKMTQMQVNIPFGPSLSSRCHPLSRAPRSAHGRGYFGRCRHTWDAKRQTASWKTSSIKFHPWIMLKPTWN